MPFISNGTTILDNGAFSVSLGSQVLLSTSTASASSSISFTSGIDSTYPIYKFEYINCQPADGTEEYLSFQGSTNGGSSYGVTTTSTALQNYSAESGTLQRYTYRTDYDLAQSTSYQPMVYVMDNESIVSVSGNLYLFNPSSTTYVKHYMIENASEGYTNYSIRFQVAGYFNTTSAINAIDFKMSSGNIASGQIKLYGIKDS